jgi:hypothetical protein
MTRAEYIKVPVMDGYITEAYSKLLFPLLNFEL